MRANVIGHALLLVVAAALAFYAWNKEDAGDDEQEIVLAALEQKDIEELSLKGPESEAKVTPVKAGEDLSWAVALDYEEKPAAPKKEKKDEAASDAGPSAVVVEEPAPVKKSARFPGGRTVVKSVEALAPLKARRTLGEVPPDRLKAMGLEEPARKLVVKASGGRQWTFLVGEATYGDQGRYAMLEGKRDVLLLDAAVVRGLEGTPTRLMEAALVEVPLDDVTGFDVESGGKKASFEHRERDQPKKRFFAVKGSEEKAEEATGLLSTLRGLRAKEYVEKAALEGATGVARVVIGRHEAAPVTVVVYEKPDGSDYLVEVGAWIGAIGTARGKNVVDDVTAALPAE